MTEGRLSISKGKQTDRTVTTASPASGPHRRRRDAVANHERLLTAAVEVIAQDGVNVALSTIARSAGVGIGTFYRCFPNRAALLGELAARAFGELEAILDELDRQQLSGREVIRGFLERSVAIADRLILPLRGAPPVGTDQTQGPHHRFLAKLNSQLARGRQDGSIRVAVNAMDVIAASAILTRPTMPGPGWDLIAARHIAVYVSGLGHTDAPLPGPPVQFDVKRNTLKPVPHGQA